MRLTDICAKYTITCYNRKYLLQTEIRVHCRVGHGSLLQNPTQPNPKFLDPTQPNPQKSPPDPTQFIIDTWYGILGYTENFIQQLLHVTDKFTVNDSYYLAAVLISRQWSIS